MKSALLTALILFASASASAKTLTIGIDQSVSNPLVLSEAYARVAAGYVRSQVASLQLGDWVRVRTFGERTADHFPSEAIRITRSMRADKVAELVSRYIASLPSKPLQGQGQTNILAFLEFGQFDCQNAGRVLLLTDGIESSQLMDDRSLFAGKALPAPSKDLLKGCEVTMFGFGQSRDGSIPPQAIKTLRASWTTWMQETGAVFHAIIDP
jgi:hypothetical protein